MPKLQLVLFVHENSNGALRTAIPTRFYPNDPSGAIDLVYFLAGPDGTPHAAERVPYSPEKKPNTWHVPEEAEEPTNA